MDNIHANYTVLLWLLQETKARIQALELLQVCIIGYYFKPKIAEQPFVEPLTELHAGRYATSSGESGHVHRPRKVTYVIINKNVRPPWNFFYFVEWDFSRESAYDKQD